MYLEQKRCVCYPIPDRILAVVQSGQGSVETDALEEQGEKRKNPRVWPAQYPTFGSNFLTDEDRS